MTTVKMHVVQPEELGERVPLETPVAPVIIGKGENDYVCGVCGNTLMSHVRYTQVRDVVLHCIRCGANNDVEVRH
jgi:hypothetical protein